MAFHTADIRVKRSHQADGGHVQATALDAHPGQVAPHLLVVYHLDGAEGLVHVADAQVEAELDHRVLGHLIRRVETLKVLQQDLPHRVAQVAASAAAVILGLLALVKDVDEGDVDADEARAVAAGARADAVVDDQAVLLVKEHGHVELVGGRGAAGGALGVADEEVGLRVVPLVAEQRPAAEVLLEAGGGAPAGHAAP